MTPPDETSWRYPGWRVAAASAVGVLVSFGSLLVYTFGIFLKPLAEQFLWSREAVSAAFGFAAISVAICSPPLGLLLDRFGPKRIILPSLLIFGCAFASLSLLTAPIWHLYAIFVVMGIVGNGTAQLAHSRAVAGWFVKRRGLAFAIVMTGSALGSIVLPPFAQMLINRLGWRGAAVALGGVILAVGLPTVALFVRERPGERQQSRIAATGVTVREGLRSRPFWILVAMLFLSSIGQNGAITHLSALLTDRGISAQEAALAVSVMGGASLLGRVATGWLLDRFFAPRVAFCIFALAAAGPLVLSGAHSLALAAAGTFLMGFGMGSEADVTPYILTRYFGLRSFSTLYALTWTFYAVAAAIGPIVMGRAFDQTASYQSSLTMFAVMTFAGALLMLLLPRYRDLNPPA